VGEEPDDSKVPILERWRTEDGTSMFKSKGTVWGQRPKKNRLSRQGGLSVEGGRLLIHTRDKTIEFDGATKGGFQSGDNERAHVMGGGTSTEDRMEAQREVIDIDALQKSIPVGKSRRKPRRRNHEKSEGETFECRGQWPGRRGGSITCSWCN